MHSFLLCQWSRNTADIQEDRLLSDFLNWIRTRPNEMLDRINWAIARDHYVYLESITHQKSRGSFTDVDFLIGFESPLRAVEYAFIYDEFAAERPAGRNQRVCLTDRLSVPEGLGFRR